MKKLVSALVSLSLASSLYAGVKATAYKSSIAEESFQTYVALKALEKLGYETQDIKEVSYAVAYSTLAQNKDSDEVLFMTTNWDPLHNNMYDKVKGDETLYRDGIFIESSAQGYLIDKKTADKYNIKYINDLQDPKIAKLFDVDGNGKADLSGCNPGWGCEKVIEYQLDAFNLRDTIEHKQGEYSAIIADTITRYNNDQPILYYTWTPYWVSGKLVPGKDVVWLQVKKSAHPVTKDTALPNGMNFGFNVNNQRIVANASIKEKHPDVAKLFSIMKIDVNDVSAENMLIANGQNKEKDIQNHANIWIKQNQELFNKWINEAKALQK